MVQRARPVDKPPQSLKRRKPPQSQPALTLAAAAALLGLCADTARRHAERGDFPGAFRVGRLWRVDRVQFDPWRARLRAANRRAGSDHPEGETHAAETPPSAEGIRRFARSVVDSALDLNDTELVQAVFAAAGHLLTAARRLHVIELGSRAERTERARPLRLLPGSAAARRQP